MFSRSPLFALALAPAALLAGCGAVNRGVESVHQPVVSRTDYVFDAASGGYGLAPGEAARLAGWMASLRVGYGDTIAVDDPTGAGGARGEVAAAAAQRGLLLADDAPVTAGPVTPGTVRVIVSRARAGVPSCPDHSLEYEPNLDARTSSNFGCAINANLAAMIANPLDLVRGQPGADSVDPALGIKAIETYRKAPSTGAGGLKAESTGGK